MFTPASPKMAFHKYSSIPNQVKEIQRDLDRDPDVIWVATHKYHGANCQVHWSEDGGIKLGRRNGFLEKDENFHQFEKIVEGYNDAFTRLFALFPDATNIRVYGEVYGGSYNGEGVEGVRAVQTGVWYSPEHRFIAFDVRIDDDYLSIYDAVYLCGKVGIPFVRIHKRGLFKEVYEWAKEHSADLVSDVDSTPDLVPIDDNRIEGWVIRSCKDHTRLKVKNPNFAEIKTVRKKEPQVNGYEDEIAKYVTRERAINVCSHESPDYLIPRNTKELGIKLKDDVLKECDSDSILHEEKALKFLTSACCQVISRHLKSL